MPQITTTAEARHACWTVGTVSELEPFTDHDGTVLEWTFRAPGIKLRHGWVLTDGRVSPAMTDYRDEAEQYGRDTAKDL